MFTNIQGTLFERYFFLTKKGYIMKFYIKRATSWNFTCFFVQKFYRVPANLLDKLSSKCLVQQSHRVSFLDSRVLLNPLWYVFLTIFFSLQLGISGKVFLENMKLIDFFKILAMSTDRNKNVYVSAVQARDYPIFGVQWHPEVRFSICLQIF